MNHNKYFVSDENFQHCSILSFVLGIRLGHSYSVLVSLLYHICLWSKDWSLWCNLIVVFEKIFRKIGTIPFKNTFLKKRTSGWREGQVLFQVQSFSCSVLVLIQWCSSLIQFFMFHSLFCSWTETNYLFQLLVGIGEIGRTCSTPDCPFLLQINK